MSAAINAAAYFASHPLHTRLAAFSATEISGAQMVAEGDVRAALCVSTLPDEADIRAAVCEQALYLLLNPEALSGRNDCLSSERVSGASKGYNERTSVLCSRAAALIARFISSGEYGATGTLSTGVSEGVMRISR